MSHDVTQTDTGMWREKYGRERKKSRVLMVAPPPCVQRLRWALGSGASASRRQRLARSRASGQMMPGGTPPAGGQMPDLAGQLFEDDGSVNTEALEQFLSRQPSGSIDQFLEFAQQNGQLTSEQADALKAAAQELQQS